MKSVERRTYLMKAVHTLFQNGNLPFFRQVMFEQVEKDFLCTVCDTDIDTCQYVSHY